MEVVTNGKLQGKNERTKERKSSNLSTEGEGEGKQSWQADL
jgi:hypothetical protein